MLNNANTRSASLFMRKKSAIPLTKNITLKSFGPAIAWFFIVFVLIIMPGDNLPGKESWLSWLEVLYPDKWVHLTMFAVMTFLFLLPIAESGLFKKIKRHYFIRIGIAACIWGLTTEFIQKFYCPTRDFDIFDWAADSIGILLAIIYCWKFHRR